MNVKDFKFSELKYERPDMGNLRSMLQVYIKSFKSAKSFEEADALFLNYEKSFEKFETMRTIAHIRNTADMNDKFYESEMQFFNEEIPKFAVEQSQADRLLLSSPYRAEFEKKYGVHLIKDIEAQVRLADEKIINERVEEAKLCQKYSKTAGCCTTVFMGENCNFYGLLKYMESPDRNLRRNAFLKWAEMYESISGELDEIYLKLVELRKAMAKKLGFKNYVDMAYLANGHYYYTADDIARFRKQVVEVIVPLSDKLFKARQKQLGVDALYYYDEMLAYPEGNAVPDGDMQQLVNSAYEMYKEMSKESGEFFGFMTDHGLFDLKTREGKHQGGYCTFLSEYKAPFIFSNFNGTSADVDVLTHEAGHALQAYLSARTLPLSSQIWATSDVCEIHSMTMEHFAYPYMDKFFGKNAQKYCRAHLSSAVTTVPYLCLVDHFQHEVYANDFDAKGLRECWNRLEKIYLPWRNYGGNAFLEGGGFWMQKQHIFLYPFYYVDYALAQIGAFEYFARSKREPEKAWRDYLSLCRAGGSRGYFELLKCGGLSDPFKDGTVEKLMKGVAAELL
ncbi:MAG: M3 family oligoendopeptidase [Clostridia bacterium]|nr:M3 family oligoendopeptidase [Clostridia bacterium]